MSSTIAEALRKATKILEEAGVRDSRRDANLLLGAILKKDLTFLIAHSDAILSEEEDVKFFNLIARRATREPFQHILGKQEFYGLEFEVNEHVLIPRPETELLVEAAIEILQNQENQFFCDVGTGSGCVAVSIMKNLPKAEAVIVDVSPQALSVAQRNAIKNRVVNHLCNLQAVLSDCFDTFPLTPLRDAKFSVIVSNPPYIPDSDSAMLQREVRVYEPHVALFGGADGLDVVRKLLRDAPKYLIQNSFLLFEIGFLQSEKVREMIDPRIWQLIEIRSDLQGIPRVVVLRLVS